MFNFQRLFIGPVIASAALSASACGKTTSPECGAPDVRIDEEPAVAIPDAGGQDGGASDVAADLGTEQVQCNSLSDAEGPDVVDVLEDRDAVAERPFEEIDSSPRDGGSLDGRDVAEEAEAGEEDGHAESEAGEDLYVDAGDVVNPTSLADGNCVPAALPAGQYDPDCVYLLGTFCEGCAGVDVLIYPPDPTRQDVGFDAYITFAGIRPTDGKLLTSSYVTAQYFSPDPFTVDYPTNPLGNDTPFGAPACSYGLSGRQRFFPDDGAALYYCSAEQTPIMYFEGTSTTFPVLGTDVLALGSDRTALIQRSGLLRLYNHGEGPVMAAPYMKRVAAARFIQGSFFVAIVLEENPWQIGLFKVDLSGQATQLGEYEISTPDSGGFFADFYGAVLDPSGSLYAITDSFSRVTKYSIEGPPVVYYDETNQRVKVHSSFLVTGP